MNQIFVDLDGVLADFDKRFLELSGGISSKEYEDTHGAKAFWKLIRDDDEFFYNLDLMPNAQKLWDFCKPLNPIILTGCPFGNWAPPQKVRWAKKHFDTDRIITCMSKDKILHAKPGDILVDDTLKYRHLWEDELKGIFIHHTDVDDTIAQLEAIYYIPYV